MSQQFRVLMVEDNTSDAELVVRELNRAGMRCESRRVETAVEYRRALEQFQPQVILSDFSMPKFDGMEALRIARQSHPDIPFIFVSGTLGEEYAIRALKSGATDFVLKNNLLRLPSSVERAIKEAEELTRAPGTRTSGPRERGTLPATGGKHPRSVLGACGRRRPKPLHQSCL